MEMDEILLDAEDRMDKTVEVFEEELRGIRTGSASSGLVENIRVEYYGSKTPLKHMANIAVPDPRLIVIKPYDPSGLESVEKAIQKSDIGINPQNDGKVIRLNIPELSEERRKQIVDRIKDMAEESRVSIRNIRRDANKKLETEENESNISEDDCARAKEQVQEMTDEHENKIDELVESKSSEIMKV